jgi:hypothetical protein
LNATVSKVYLSDVTTSKLDSDTRSGRCMRVEQYKGLSWAKTRND